jgi:hypothetical protein
MSRSAGCSPGGSACRARPFKRGSSAWNGRGLSPAMAYVCQTAMTAAWFGPMSTGSRDLDHTCSARTYAAHPRRARRPCSLEMRQPIRLPVGVGLARDCMVRIASSRTSSLPHGAKSPRSSPNKLVAKHFCVTGVCSPSRRHRSSRTGCSDESRAGNRATE